jgi:DNA ligase (NAD+)
VPRTLEGLSIVVTGSMAGFSRDEAKERSHVARRRAAGSVSKKTGVRRRGRRAGVEVRQGPRTGVPLLDENGFPVLL